MWRPRSFGGHPGNRHVRESNPQPFGKCTAYRRQVVIVTATPPVRLREGVVLAVIVVVSTLLMHPLSTLRAVAHSGSGGCSLCGSRGCSPRLCDVCC